MKFNEVSVKFRNQDRYGKPWTEQLLSLLDNLEERGLYRCVEKIDIIISIESTSKGYQFKVTLSDEYFTQSCVNYSLTSQSGEDAN